MCQSMLLEEGLMKRQEEVMQWQPKVLLVSMPAKGQSGNVPVYC